MSLCLPFPPLPTGDTPPDPTGHRCQKLRPIPQLPRKPARAASTLLSRLWQGLQVMHDTLCSEETLQPGFSYTPGLDPVPLWSPVNMVLREDPLWVSLSVA